MQQRIITLLCVAGMAISAHAQAASLKSAPRCAATLRREKRRHTLGHLRQISVQPVAVEPPFGAQTAAKSAIRI